MNVGYEIRLVLEYCDQGTLRDALDQNRFCRPGEGGAAGQVGGRAGGEAGQGWGAEGEAARWGGG